MQPAELQRLLAGRHRLDLYTAPTPLEPLPRLSRLLNGPTLWIKRDDGIGPGMGGNKARKLRYLLAEAQQQGRRRVVTFGGLQSNHARITAAACAKLDMRAHLFFFERKPAALPGNLLLDHLLGARLHFIPLGGRTGSMTLERTVQLVRLVALLRLGSGFYFVPVGGHTVTGCLGYVEAAAELAAQSAELALPPNQTTVITAAGTGGTLAGLLAGAALLAAPFRVLGLDIGKLWRGFPASIAQLATGLCRELGGGQRFSAENVPLIEDRYAGPAYAKLTPATTAAIQLLAQTEGIVLDPVYTGKAFAGLLDLITQGRFGPADHVIFLHTGGTPGLWAYNTLAAC